MTIDKILQQTRYESGRSQEYMALALSVSRRTVQHWESGVSEPSVSAFLAWFRLLGRNPLPYLLQNIYPTADRISAGDPASKLRKALLDMVKELPEESVRQLLYLLYGDHGSSPRAVLNMVTAHLQTPMKDRITHGRIILHNYEINEKKRTLTAPAHVQPDTKLLHAAIEAGEKAFLEDQKEYSL